MSMRKPPVGGSCVGLAHAYTPHRRRVAFLFEAFVVDGNEAEAARGVATYLGAGADLAALQHGVDFTLGLRLLEAILGHDLSHEVGLALKRGDLLLRRVHSASGGLMPN